MTIQVEAFANFREILGKETAAKLKEHSSINDLLTVLCMAKAKLRIAAFDETGGLRDCVMKMKNPKNIGSAGRSPGSELQDGDKLAHSADYRWLSS